ncbi:helix-turn-helix domain-containing protein [Undibacterium sp. Di26W]|uniref:helix-turn-helix domain-containing protein n=1 Tax=Undibacterium sp. Di26W TaxID=3413035 RepID=UPI003BF1EAE4
MYHFTDGGLRNVWLANGYVEHNTPYGKGVSFHDLEGLIKAICAAIVNKPGKLTGAEFRYLRCALGLSQKSLGHMMGYSEQALAKWEKTGKIPKSNDFHLRCVYMSHRLGDQKISTMIESIKLIDRIANTRIIVSEHRKKWKSTFEVDEIEQDEQTLEAA